ncbi:MAG: DUF1987 domain-containing protein [Bacteroidia bacterium]
MEPLLIEATTDSPAVNFDSTTNVLSISGESRPENPAKFFAPLIDWFINYEKLLYWRKNEAPSEIATIVLRFNLGYFNSTSAKYIMDILLFIKKMIDNGYKINIEWHYNQQTDDMLDAGKEFSSFIDVDFIYVEY